MNWQIKKFIRSSEAKVSLNFLGIPSSRAYCLNLPFYGTNHFNRKNPGEEDYEQVRSLLRLIEPTVIFAAGKKILIQVILLILMALTENVLRYWCKYMMKSGIKRNKTRNTNLWCQQLKSSSFTEELGRNGVFVWLDLLFPCLPKKSTQKLLRSGNISPKKMGLCSWVKTRENSGREQKKETEEQLST